MKSASLASATTGPRPACEGVAVAGELVAVERHAGFEAQSVAAGQAGGHQFAVSAPAMSACQRPAASLVGHVDLEAVLAGVAGAGQQEVLAVTADVIGTSTAA